MEPITYTIEFAPLEDGGFLVTVPALPGCVTWGESFDHALEMAREAIELWLEELQEHGESIPEERAAARPVKPGIQGHRLAMV